MASQGDLIKLSNFPTGFQSIGVIRNITSITSVHYWTYICAPCFVLSLIVFNNSISFPRRARFTIMRYNGTSWVAVEPGTSTELLKNAYFYHNCGTEHYSPVNGPYVKGDHGNQHLYRIGCRGERGAFSTSYAYNLELYVGNSIMSGSNDGNARGTAVGDLIKRTGSNDYYWNSGIESETAASISTDTQAVNKWKSSNYRGTLITTSSIPYMCNTAY